MTFREPVDAARLVKDWLKNDLADRFPELSVRLELPANWSLGSGPVLVVADDGGPVNLWPVATSPTVRVTSWTSGRQTLYAYAAMARLLEEQIPGIVILRGSAFLEARDPKTGGDLVSFLVPTRVRTQISAAARLLPSTLPS